MSKGYLALFVYCIIPAGLFYLFLFSTHNPSFAVTQESPRQNTQDLLNSSKYYNEVTAQNKPQLFQNVLQLGRWRNQNLKAVLQTDPRILFDNALPNALRSQIPPEVRLLIEQKRRIQGRFVWEHSDDFAAGTSADDLYIDESSGKRYKLYFAQGGLPSHVKHGDIVSAQAVVLDEYAVVEDASSIEIVEQAVIANVTSKKILVLLINFSDKNTQPWTIDQVRNTIFTGTSSVNKYYQEVSFGQWDLIGKLRSDGDIYGWFTIPHTSAEGCTTSTIVSQAHQAAQAAGIDITGYDHRIYAWPSISCGWAGKAVLGGSYSYINGSMTIRVVGHELGHNFRMHHASSYRCTENGQGVVVSQPENCTMSEYGDPFSIMGSGTNHMHNYHKGTRGTSAYNPNWLKIENTLTIDRHTSPDGVYVITPIEWVSDGIQALRIPRSVPSSGVESQYPYYYLEFRQPYGLFDNFSLSSPQVNGIIIRTGPDFTSVVRSRILDMVPGTTTFSDAPLLIGRTYYDPFDAITVTPLSVSTSNAQVRVSFGAVPCTDVAPTLTISPSSQSGGAGQTLTYQYTIKNNNASTCASSSFSLRPIVTLNWFTIPETLLSETLSPGASVSRSFSVTSSANAVLGSYQIALEASHTASSDVKSTAHAIYQVVVPDIQPPTVRIISPISNSLLPSKGTITIEASASDESGIFRIDLVLNTTSIKSCNSSNSCSLNYNLNNLAEGSHTLTARAIDNAPTRNTAETSIEVYKGVTPTPTGTLCLKKYRGDLNCDDRVGIEDLSMLLSQFGQYSTTADIDGDGLVNITDLSILLSNFGW